FSSLMALYSLSVSCFHVFLLMSRPPPASTLFPYTTLFRSTLHITPYTRPRSLRERRASRTGELAATDRTELHGTRHAVAFDRPRVVELERLPADFEADSEVHGVAVHSAYCGDFFAGVDQRTGQSIAVLYEARAHVVSPHRALDGQRPFPGHIRIDRRGHRLDRRALRRETRRTPSTCSKNEEHEATKSFHRSWMACQQTRED